MSKKLQRFLSTLLCIAIILVVCTSNLQAKENQLPQESLFTIAESFTSAYSDALLQQSLDPFEELLSENEENEFFKAFLQWRFAIMQNMDSAYNSHTCVITEKNIISNTLQGACLQITFDEDFMYMDGGMGYAYYNQAELQIVPDTNGYKISQIIFINEDEFYGNFCKKIDTLASLPTTRSGESSLEDKMSVLILELEVMGKEMDCVVQNQTPHIEENGIIPMATSYSYNSFRGVQYAQTYGLIANPYFYSTGNDCTNFVSQCIWAAYGGWSSTMSAETMQNNISNKVRMVPNIWQAGSGGGTSNWENVDSLWSYVTGNQGNGPKATGYNDGGWYTGVLPIDISTGDVLQKSSDGKDYFHSVYVVSTPGGSDPTYNLIYVAQHTGNFTSRKLSEVIGSGGCYLRQLRFHAGTFAS